jgi:hypothetical protein
MNITCQERDRIFLDGTPEEWAALQLHAAGCQECGEELHAWKNLSIAAKEMRDEPDSPQLWSRIEASLNERAGQEKRDSAWQRFKNWTPLSVGWQTALAAAMVLALTISGGYLYKHPGNLARPDHGTSALLKSPALREVENSERAYEQAIEHLETEAKPQLVSGDSPLVASYREKLMVLDGAIDELRMQAGQNPSNAHLRRQLLAMYQEKQQTLQDVLEIKR